MRNHLLLFLLLFTGFRPLMAQIDLSRPPLGECDGGQHRAYENILHNYLELHQYGYKFSPSKTYNRILKNEFGITVVERSPSSENKCFDQLVMDTIVSWYTDTIFKYARKKALYLDSMGLGDFEVRPAKDTPTPQDYIYRKMGRKFIRKHNDYIYYDITVIIDTTGAFTIKEVAGIDDEVIAEIYKILSSYPNFRPATIEGVPIAQEYTFDFDLWRRSRRRDRMIMKYEEN